MSVVKNKVININGYLRLADENKKLEEANQDLVRRNRLKARLLSIVAHDTRAPLDSLKSLLNLLKKNSLTPKEINQLASSLDYQVDQLNHFLENLLQWTRTHFDQGKIRPVRLPLQKLINETMALLSLSAERKQVYLETDVSAEVMIYADAEIVKLVLRNLISNAIKFSDANGQVFITSKNEKAMVRIYVQDTGRGISEENIKNLFNLSHLSTNGTKGEIGTGLGLTLCQEFIEKMGGDIRVTSAEGIGSCFEFTVPAIPISETSNGNSVPVLK